MNRLQKSSRMANDQNLGKSLGAGIGIGVAIGAGIGVALHNIAVGIGIGVALGVSIGLGLGQRDTRAKKRFVNGDEQLETPKVISFL